MKKTISLVPIILILLLSSMSINAFYTNEDDLVIYVDDDNTAGPWDGTIQYPFQHIQDGINASENGYQIFVFNGTYYENLIVTKTIELIGENKNETIIDGIFFKDVIKIFSDNCAINNFTIRNSGGYDTDSGISVLSNKNIIINCSIYWTKTAILLSSNEFNILDNCSIYYSGIGILLNTSNYNVLKGCTLGQNSIGIQIVNSNNFVLKNSYLHTNGRAFYFENTSFVEILHCNISDNSVNHGGIFIIDSKNVDIFNNIICHNGAGISLDNSSSIKIVNCILCRNTHFAVWIKNYCENVEIIDTEIINNYRFGIYVVDSHCVIQNSNIYINYLYGIFSSNSVCISRKNYWGSPLGPSFTDLRESSRINPVFGRIRYFPWRLLKISDIGANWQENEDYMNKKIEPVQKIIKLPGNDTDGDNVPDWWEEKWGYDPNIWDNHLLLDPDGDGLNNIEECYTDSMDSNPFYKDIFLEIDWIESGDETSNKPDQEMVKEAIYAFEQNNVKLHIDVGNLGGGEEISYISNFSFPYLCNLYWNYFLHNDLNNPRKGIFHYGIICDYGPDVNFPFFGWDTLDSFLISAKLLQQKLPRYSKSRIIMGGSIHHLGHTLGLLADKYTGIDNLETLVPLTVQWIKHINYKSCMNYFYKYKTFSYSNGDNGPLDFNDWENIDFSFFKNSGFY